MNPSTPKLQGALKDFAAAVTGKLALPGPGEPEDQLRGPFEQFVAAARGAIGWDVVCKGEPRLPRRLGQPDFAVYLNHLLSGYVELKAPGVGADAASFKGHDRKQFERFTAIPNILYTDGNEWALYRDGELVDAIVRLSGDVARDGAAAVKPPEAQLLETLLRKFFSWEPIIPIDGDGRIDLKGFAGLLAPLTRLLRQDLTEALQNADSPLLKLAKEWRQLLFPAASDDQFADAYAQTVAFALLLGRSEGADPLSLDSAEKALSAQHNLLSRALQVLTDRHARDEMAASVELLLRLIGRVPPAPLGTGAAAAVDPWLYFYEDFLAAYDPQLRKDVGAYYTPVEVVRCQVRLIDHLLVNRLNKPLGFADPGVITLDPAAGTGTYLLGVIRHALGRVEAEQGRGAVAGQATQLARHLYGFELMVGPYAVAELRVTRALRDSGAAASVGGAHIYLTDTLESPHTQPLDFPSFYQPIAEQHQKALQVKSAVPVIVCLGNPPYDRHEAARRDEDKTVVNKARTGGWVRWGDEPTHSDAIFREFLEPAVAAGHSVHLKNLYNFYVYFWRWALWKVFEQKKGARSGVVSFISASSYLDGDAFCGMREHMRRVCDEIWILDLGGEGRGTRQTENVFAIRTPVAIAVAVRSGNASRGAPARVHYARIEGTREAKLKRLDAIANFKKVKWQDCPSPWQAPFRPAGRGAYFAWPLLTDLMPWQHSGVKAGRTWVISPDENTLKKRWGDLLKADKPARKELFKDSPTGRKVHQAGTQLPPATAPLNPIIDLARGTQPPEIVRFAYRSFDRQYVFADARLLDRPGPSLWRAHSDRQVYLTTLLNHPLGRGPAVCASALIPDKHHFRGSFGAKEVLPMYRSRDTARPNIAAHLFEHLSFRFSEHRKMTPEDFLAYLYGVLAQPAFTARFHEELETRQLRVPMTKDPALFKKVRDLGANLLWLHTFGERFVPKGRRRGRLPRGQARCAKAVPADPQGYPEDFDYNNKTRTLRVGRGEFAPVAEAVYAFEVSGLKVVQSWLKYRMKRGAGRKSSPLDDLRPQHWTSQFTSELIELLWVLEATVALYPEMARLLEKVVAGECFSAEELTGPTPPPRRPSGRVPQSASSSSSSSPTFFFGQPDEG